MALSPLELKLQQILGQGASQANASQMPSDQGFQPPIQALSSTQDDSLSQASAPTTSPAQNAAPGGDTSALLARMVSSSGGREPASVRSIQDALRAKLEESRAQQQQNIDLDKQALINQYSKKQDLDLSGGYAAARMLGAKHAGEGYKSPEDVEKNDLPIRAQLSKNQQALTDDETNQLRYELQSKLQGQARAQMMRENMNERVYGRQVQGLRDDKTLNKIIENNNSITRTVDVLFAPGQELNTTSLHDLQQTVTGALTGLAGGGIGTERAERYMTSLETDFDKLKQKFGDVDSIPRDNPILQHYLSLAQEGQAFLQDQAHKRIKTLSGGHENITTLPVYADQFQRQIEDIKGNITKPRFFNKPINEVSENFQNAYPAPGSKKAYAGGGLTPEEQKELADLKAKHGKR